VKIVRDTEEHALQVSLYGGWLIWETAK
jgi:hypothetical protein